MSNNQKLYITGWTLSNSFPNPCPTAPDPYCVAKSGGADVFIARFHLDFTITGIDEDNIADNSNALLIYPNPAQDYLTMTLEVEQKEDISVKIYNAMGQMVKNDVLTEQSGRVTYNIDVQGLAKGVYMLQVTIGNDSINKKIIKH